MKIDKMLMEISLLNMTIQMFAKCLKEYNFLYRLNFAIILLEWIFKKVATSIVAWI